MSSTRRQNNVLPGVSYISDLQVLISYDPPVPKHTPSTTINEVGIDTSLLEYFSKEPVRPTIEDYQDVLDLFDVKRDISGYIMFQVLGDNIRLEWILEKISFESPWILAVWKIHDLKNIITLLCKSYCQRYTETGSTDWMRHNDIKKAYKLISDTMKIHGNEIYLDSSLS